MGTTFQKLNHGWNADPNAPEPTAKWIGTDLQVTFRPGWYEPDSSVGCPVSKIVFEDCARFRIGSVNDEGWYRGQCRFSRVAPSWGEFYEVSGDLRLSEVPGDWQQGESPLEGTKHFLFYFRDEEFECDARSWRIEKTNAEQGVAPNA